MSVAQTVPVNVTYNIDNGTFTYNPPAPDVAVLAGNNNYAVVFTLTGANWADNWITWGPGNGAPPGLQSGYTLPPLGGGTKRQIGVNNNNTGTTNQRFNFVLNIVTNFGKTEHSPDPDIVLDPP